MCTAISYRRSNHYFGRTLDVEFTFKESVVITPRSYLFNLRNGKSYRNKFALIGMAAVMENYPLYYEASNEMGLSMAGLNFPGSAVYNAPRDDMDNITPFELIPYVLGQAKSVDEAREIISKINLTKIAFATGMGISPLHFMLSDSKESIVVEPLLNGLKIYNNPYNVMTNNPPFDYHLWNMQGYLNLSAKNGENEFSDEYTLGNYAVGMGAVGLPGDYSSSSRFIRAAFNLTNSQNSDNELDNVTQFFHILGSVSMVKGAVITDDDKNDITRYTCCINATDGIYYYTTYDNSTINAVSLNNVDLDSQDLFIYELRDSQTISYQN